MKLKFFLVILSAFLLLSGIAAPAADALQETAVRHAVNAYCTAQLKMDISKMLEFCAADYTEQGYSGEMTTVADLKKIAGYCEKMQNSEDLLVIMENALLIQGQQLTGRQKDEIAELKKSGKDKIFAAGIRKTFADLRSAGEKAQIDIRSVKIDQNSAVAEISIKSASGEIYFSSCTLTLAQGKWFVRKNEYKGVLTK